MIKTWIDLCSLFPFCVVFDDRLDHCWARRWQRGSYSEGLAGRGYNNCHQFLGCREAWNVEIGEEVMQLSDGNVGFLDA